MTNISEIKEMGWNFDNSYASLSSLFYKSQNPTPVSSPELTIFNSTLAKSLGLKEQELQSDEGILIFAGNKVPEGSFPIAQAYAGHQFGHFTMLGDGRAILLGEQINPKGERFDIQLKGPGRTPYSRGGDGRAALGPMLREYIISEAMYGLGIPTTRSLAVVKTGDSIIRETVLPGAILTRVAASHIRVGTFEYTANWGTVEDIRTLANYTINRHYPEIKGGVNPYLKLLQEVIKSQVSLIAKWMLVGFIHGVMNTDNMAISGESIDYGPCAFMDAYDSATVFSSIDRQGRYAYGNQPNIAGWNLARFAETLLPLLDENQDHALKLAQDELSKYNNLYLNYWLSGIRTKLGLFDEESQDSSLIERLLGLMKKHGADFTNTFKALTIDKFDCLDLYNSSEFKEWYKEWKERQERQQESEESIKKLMKKSNPAVIPRNHRVEEALDAAVKQGDYSVMNRLLEVLSRPYDYTPDQEEYSKLPQASNQPYRTFCGT